MTFVEVDVEVGHLTALGVQEPLEHEAVTQRVETRDTETVRRDRSGSASTARSDPDALALRPIHDVTDDQEEPGEAHAPDHFELVVDTVEHFLRDRIAVPLLAHLRSTRRRRYVSRDDPSGGTKSGSLQLAERDLHVAALGHVERPVDRLGVVAEDGLHLLPRLEIERIAVETQSPGLVDGRARLQTQKDVVRLGVLTPRVVQVVGRDHRDAQRASRARPDAG